MKARYHHLTEEDRIEIQHLLENGHSQAHIARTLGVAPSTISREIRARSWQPESEHANLRPYLRNKLNTRAPRDRIYLAVKAQHHADKRKQRSHQPYRMRYEPLLNYVIDGLRRGWSPERISGRLRLDHPEDPGMRVSAETIYQWIYAPEQKHRLLHQYLYRARPRRGKRGGRGVRGERIKFRVPVSERPERVFERQEFGHWECDLVIGRRGSGVLLTFVERASRLFKAVLLPRGGASEVLEAQRKVFKALPAHCVKSVTTDNGSEFAWHYLLREELGVDTYFCDPYSAFQRGSNEHFNGRLRRYLPKGSSFEGIDQGVVDEVVAEINDCPVGVLGYLTPAEVFEGLCLEPLAVLGDVCCTSK